MYDSYEAWTLPKKPGKMEDNDLARTGLVLLVVAPCTILNSEKLLLFALVT